MASHKTIDGEVSDVSIDVYRENRRDLRSVTLSKRSDQANIVLHTLKSTSMLLDFNGDGYYDMFSNINRSSSNIGIEKRQPFIPVEGLWRKDSGENIGESRLSAIRRVCLLNPMNSWMATGS